MRHCLWIALWISVCSHAQTGWPADLLRADAPGRAAILKDHSPAEIAAALEQIESTGVARAKANDRDGALTAFQAAIEIAETSGVTARVAFYCRQMGLQYSAQGHSDLALDVYRRGIAAAEKSGDRPMLVDNLHGAAVALRRLSRYKEAQPYSEREWGLVEHDGPPLQQASALLTYSANLGDLGRGRESLALLERAVEISRKNNLEEPLTFALTNLASHYSALGENENGLRYLRELTGRGANANAWVMIGIIERRLHHDAESEKAYRTAIAQATTPAAWTVLATALADLGILEHSRRQYDAAREHTMQALKIAQEHHNRQLEGGALNELSGIAFNLGNFPEALALAEKAMEAARETGHPDRVGDALLVLGNAQEATGQAAAAGETFTEAVSVIEAMRAETPNDPTALTATLEHWLPVYRAAVAHELTSGNPTAALRISERAKARVLLDILEGGVPDIDSHLSPDERAERQKLRDAVVRARRAYLAKPSPALRRALGDAELPAGAFEQRLNTRHPELYSPAAAIPQLTPELLGTLTPDRRTAVVSYFRLTDELAIFVVRAGASVRAVTIPYDDSLDTRLASFRNLIANRDLDYRPAARKLFDTLVAPVSEALRGADRWIVSPDSSLWDLPFQALIDPAGKHLLETHTLTYAPSLSSLHLLRERDLPAVPLLAVAEDIPGAEGEAAAIARLYGTSRSVVLNRREASIAGFQGKAGDAAVIHIASHAEVDPGHPLESFLALTPAGGDDGALTARRILDLHLRARLVVLSACETARGKIAHGEGILGLGWAFAAAGVPATVLSQWKVDGVATRDLMIDFHRRLTSVRGVDKAEALRQAELAAMRTPGHQHPFYWAGFILTGK